MFEALPRTNPPKSTLTYAFCIYVSAIAVSYFSSEKSRDTFKILQIFQYLLLRQNFSGVGSGQPEHARASLHYNFVSIALRFLYVLFQDLFLQFLLCKNAFISFRGYQQHLVMHNLTLLRKLLF